MKVMRRFIHEPGEIVEVARTDTPDPEKGVLNARFSLTRLPVLSDDDLSNAAKRRKKGKKQMTNVDEQDEAEGKSGRAKKYPLVLDAPGVTVTADVLEKDQKDDDGKVIKTHKVETKEIKVTDLNGFLALFANDETKMFEFVSEFVTSYYQRNDRQKLTALAAGPEKSMLRTIAGLVAGGFSEDMARTTAIELYKTSLGITVTVEELAEAEAKQDALREKQKAARLAKAKS